MRAFVRNLNVIVCLFVSLSVAAQKPPQGTVQLKPSKTGTKHAAFIDKTEITVLAWLEFLFWNEREYGRESAEYREILPDSQICLVAYPLESYPESWKYPGYWRCRDYWNYPIVGITYEQAMRYCAWRAERVNEILRFNNEKYRVSYTLPTEADFKEAYNQQKIKTDNKTLTSCCWKNNCKKKGKLIHIADNAHELTSNKTVLTGENAGVLQFQPYQGANAKTGFRCVAEIQN